jgi:quinol monooxygenase YgiN
MSGRVFLDGYIEVPPERLAAVTRALPDHIALTRAEPGCLAFSVTPSPDHPDRFLVSEIFADQAAFDAHQLRAKASAWAVVTAGLARHYTVRTER